MWFEEQSVNFFHQLPVKFESAVTFHGPPGSGKTFLARTLLCSRKYKLVESESDLETEHKILFVPRPETLSPSCILKIKQAAKKKKLVVVTRQLSANKWLRAQTHCRRVPAPNQADLTLFLQHVADEKRLAVGPDVIMAIGSKSERNIRTALVLLQRFVEGVPLTADLPWDRELRILEAGQTDQTPQTIANLLHMGLAPTTIIKKFDLPLATDKAKFQMAMCKAKWEHLASTSRKPIFQIEAFLAEAFAIF